MDQYQIHRMEQQFIQTLENKSIQYEYLVIDYIQQIKYKIRKKHMLDLLKQDEENKPKRRRKKD